MMDKKYTVYLGYDANYKIAYVGTTIQKPKDRFRWHKYNGKDLIFKVVDQFDNPDSMLSLEYELIKKYEPILNKIKHRKQNLNVKLSKEDIDKRKGDKEWCQSCLKRRIKKGYEFCFWCAK